MNTPTKKRIKAHWYLVSAAGRTNSELSSGVTWKATLPQKEQLTTAEQYERFRLEVKRELQKDAGGSFGRALIGTNITAVSYLGYFEAEEGWQL
jgi:hypothetical protein